MREQYHFRNPYSKSYTASVVVLGLKMSSRTNFESLALALKVKSLVLALRIKSLALSKSPWPWPNRSLRLAGLVICQTNNTATMLKSARKCLLHELVPPLSYFFLVLCSLATRNLKRSLNTF